jgi:hypothetical protein
MKLLMENFKKFLNEAKEEATREEIKAIVHKVLEDEGGAAGLDPIKKELEKLELPEGSMDELILSVDGVKKHDKGDYILTIGLEEAEELEEKRFADDPKLDKDGDGVPKWADKDDNDPKVGSKKKVKTEVVSEHLSYHLKNKLSLTESVFRAGSDAYIDLVKEARVLWKMGGYQPKIEELELLQSDIGQFGIYEDVEVPLDTPMLNEVELEEAKKKPKLNKPMRNTGAGKKYKVFVRNPKTGNIKKVTFGDKKGGLEGNWNDPEARASFAKRHKCAEKKDKTKPGYWACRAHKYFGKNVPGRFW